METQTLKKLNLIDCIYQTQTINISVFSNILDCSSITIQRYITEMFGDNPTKNKSFLTIEQYKILRKKIIDHSISFKIFSFYLTNTISDKNKRKSFKLFLKESFISTSYAFVVRKKIIEFLKKHDLYLKNSCIMGNPQKVRFIIVVTQYFFDCEIIKISPNSKLISCRTVAEAEKIFNLNFSKDDEDILVLFICFSLDYGYKFPIDPNFIKEKFLISKGFIDKVLQISLVKDKTIAKNEKIFILMVFLIQSGYSPDSKIEEIWGMYIDKFTQSQSYKILDNLFKKSLYVSLSYDKYFKDILFSLLWRGRRPIHALLPQKFIYLNETEFEIYEKVKDIISIWKKQTLSPIYLVDSDLKLFSRRLYTILELKNSLVKVGYVCSKPIERDLTTKIIQKKFGNSIELCVYKDEEEYSQGEQSDLILLDSGIHFTQLPKKVYYISSPPSETQLDHIWGILKSLT
ncbi:hypothetical protein [Enterococcus sp. DIV1420a]|uniref:hypothetical protein n=1 Tax=Enterococcus sp. DIV1420a TaxID=2774672 RepID=UPI003F68865D